MKHKITKKMMKKLKYDLYYKSNEALQTGCSTGLVKGCSLCCEYFNKLDFKIVYIFESSC